MNERRSAVTEAAGGSAAIGAAEPWPSPGRAYYAVVIFSLSLMINFLDRGVVNLLAQPIKEDLHLTDSQLAVILGFAYALFYAILGLPIARLIDRSNRSLILAAGVTVWSVMTALCGLAHTYWQLFAARVGVGVGESSSGPSTFSMISDLFPPEKLARAISVLNFGFVAGNAGAFLLGGVIYGYFVSIAPVSLPLIGELRPWQLTFIALGVPGLIVAGLLATLGEPKRRGAGAATNQSIPLREVGRFFWASRRAYLPMFAALACNTIIAFGGFAWTPAFFMRTYHWSIPDLGLVSGLTFLICWPPGLMLGTLLAERLTRKGYDDAYLRVTLWSLIAYLPFQIAATLMPSIWLSFTMLALAQFLVAFGVGPQNAALQIITPNRMRGQITALFLFIFNLVGFGLGPTIVAFFTDRVFGDESQLRYSLAATAAILGPISLLLFWYALKGYAERVREARAWT
jgi:MFS family permease